MAELINEINLIDKYRHILSDEAIEYIENYHNGISPGAFERISLPDTPVLKKADAAFIKELDARFDKGVERVRASESEWTLAEGGKIIYVSAEGDDSNDGLSPSTPKRTPDKLGEELLCAGDVVLFRRGDMWHSRIWMVSGVTYSAYGEGAKPDIRGSFDGAGADKWIKVNDKGLYKFHEPIDETLDIGNIVFDDGKYYGSKVVKQLDKNERVPSGDRGISSNGVEYWKTQYEYMESAEVLRHDLEYYHEHSTSTLFLLSLHGNPSERFDEIELSPRRHIVHGNANDCVLDNLCLRFTGGHGIGAGTCKNFTVRNCEIGWIGGSFQHTKTMGLCRYGNAIEIFGGCDGYRVYNNYVYQCFDCGPTVQWQGTLKEGSAVIENDIEMYDNVIETCNSPLEVWCTAKDCDRTRFAVLANINLHDNLCRRAGYGFGGYTHQKFDYNCFYGGQETRAVYDNAVIENNTMWDLRKYLQKAIPTHTKNTVGFNWRNNVIVKELEGPLSFLASDLASARGGFVVYNYNEKTVKELMELGVFGENEFYYTVPKVPSIK